jgi:hypothetical protein
VPSPSGHAERRQAFSLYAMITIYFHFFGEKMISKLSMLTLFFFFFSAFNCKSLLNKSEPKDNNNFTSNRDDDLSQPSRYFIPLDILRNLTLGIREDDLYKFIGSSDFSTRFSFQKELPKRITKSKHIPVTKIVKFFNVIRKISSGIDYVEYQPSERLDVVFYFYKERLIYFSITHIENRKSKENEREEIFLPDTTQDIIYLNSHRETEEGLKGYGAYRRGDEKYYGFVNGFLGERFTNAGKRYFIPLFPKSKFWVADILGDYCKLFAYWESPDFEAELQKSGYYKLKAKLDKDYENKSGYWEEKSIK